MCKMLELTVTCFACGMPFASVKARKVLKNPPRYQQHLLLPFYPQLQEKECPPGAVVGEDGCVQLCPFCHALVDSQAKHGTQGEQPGWTFVCAVCAVETYRKRVRALPIKKFQFLSKMRKPGSISITFGDSECVVVCLDCSETLWIQSDEYDRWGLPEARRHFNWMARPPPPEDSEEASMARLPSGKSQLPRTLPTEPILSVPCSSQNQVRIATPSVEIKERTPPRRHKKSVSGRRSRSDRSNSTSSNSSSSNNTGSEVESHMQRKKRRLAAAGLKNTHVLMEQQLPSLETLRLSFSQRPHSQHQHPIQATATPIPVHPSLFPYVRVNAGSPHLSFLHISQPHPQTILHPATITYTTNATATSTSLPFYAQSHPNSIFIPTTSTHMEGHRHYNHTHSLPLITEPLPRSRKVSRALSPPILHNNMLRLGLFGNNSSDCNTFPTNVTKPLPLIKDKSKEPERGGSGSELRRSHSLSHHINTAPLCHPKKRSWDYGRGENFHGGVTHKYMEDKTAIPE